MTTGTTRPPLTDLPSPGGDDRRRRWWWSAVAAALWRRQHTPRLALVFLTVGLVRTCLLAGRRSGGRRVLQHGHGRQP